jgi:hypothetical protein
VLIALEKIDCVVERSWNANVIKPTCANIPSDLKTDFELATVPGNVEKIARGCGERAGREAPKQHFDASNDAPANSRGREKQQVKEVEQPTLGAVPFCSIP